MNEKIKNIFVIIGSFFSGLFACILGILLHNNRKSDDRIKTDTQRLSEIETGLSDIGSRLSDTNEQFADNSDRLGKLIEEIEKTRVDTKS